jgi:hypothetical protein
MMVCCLGVRPDHYALAGHLKGGIPSRPIPAPLPTKRTGQSLMLQVARLRPVPGARVLPRAPLYAVLRIASFGSIEN